MPTVRLDGLTTASLLSDAAIASSGLAFSSLGCVTLTVRACVFVCQDIVLTKAGSPILRIAMPPKREKRNNVKTGLYCMRVDVAVIIHRTHKHGQTSV